MSRSEELASDGGQPTDEELFGQIGDRTATVSRSERLSRTLDAYVYAPGRVAWHDWRARTGVFIILGFLLMGFVAWVSTTDWWFLDGVVLVSEPISNEVPVYVPPFHEGWFVLGQVELFGTGVSIPWIELHYPLGSDGFGSPIGAQIIHATPAMVKMVVAGAVVSVGAATIIGITAGYKGGTVDTALMFLTDIALTIPGLPLIIVIASIFPPEDPFLVGVLLAIDNWPGLARALRSQVLTIREESYVEASRTMGLSSPTILGKDVLPQLMPYVLINSASAARRVIFESVGLYFLGILPFTTFNWGVIMNLAYREGNALVNLAHFYWLFWPMVVIITLSFGLIMFAQGMDRVFNPRIRARHAKKVGGDDEPSMK